MTPIPAEVLDALDDAAATHGSGEIVVRGLAASARIYLYDKKIAWISCDAVKRRLGDVLCDETGLRREDLGAVLKECQNTRKAFGETLVSWGLVDEDGLRRSLLKHNAHHIAGIARMEGPLRALFVPLSRSYSNKYVFGLDELVDAMPHELDGSLLVATDNTPAFTEAEISQAREHIPHCAALAVIDLNGPRLLGVSPGDALNIEERTSLVEAVSDYLRSGAISRLEAKYGPGVEASTSSMDRLVSIGADSCTIIQRAHKHRGQVFVAVCKDYSNLGLVISMSQAELEKLDGLHG